MTKTASPLTALLACVTIAGCAGSGDKYPSLAIRDAERAQGQFSPVAPDPTPVAPVATAADIDSLVDRARRAHGAFSQAQSATQRLVASARGRSIESNARQRALVALADLATLRSDTALPMGDLDLLKAQASTTFAPTEAIDSARTTVSAILTEQDAALDAMWLALSQ